MAMKRTGLALTLTFLMALPAAAASCGNTGSGFESWKRDYAAEAKANGVGSRGLKALAATSYSTATIKADRSQKSFKLSLEQFMQKRGAAAIVAQGKKQKAANARLFASIEKRYGVAAGPLIAIWGMETAFGKFMGSQPTVSAVATLAYDCRRPEYFREQLIAALKLVDKGVLSTTSKGAMHGEVGQTQFLPKNVFLYGADGDGGGVNLNSKADALASTAKFLKGHGFPRSGPYGAGDFAGWNAATVYQKALAIMANKIDGHD
jgi:lytic murein transglycosylase